MPLRSVERWAEQFCDVQALGLSPGDRVYMAASAGDSSRGASRVKGARGVAYWTVGEDLELDAVLATVERWRRMDCEGARYLYVDGYQVGGRKTYTERLELELEVHEALEPIRVPSPTVPTTASAVAPVADPTAATASALVAGLVQLVVPLLQTVRDQAMGAQRMASHALDLLDDARRESLETAEELGRLRGERAGLEAGYQQAIEVVEDQAAAAALELADDEEPEERRGIAAVLERTLSPLVEQLTAGLGAGLVQAQPAPATDALPEASAEADVEELVDTDTTADAPPEG